MRIADFIFISTLNIAASILTKYTVLFQKGIHIIIVND